ncbi:MAG TPA: HAD-IA family hydrolase [Marinobacter sp.]|nr:HAD-IA family hydrolase [Marinobacter sp.]
MNVDVVIFDWDGTLVDSVEHIAESLHLASTALGFPALEREAYRDIIGLGIEEALQQLYPGISAVDIAGMREGYREHFFKKATTPQNVFAGIADTLVDLRGAGRRCAVATGKNRNGLDSALSSSGLGSHFGTTQCADETRSKPDPAMLARILEFYGIKPERAVMVGDTRYDLDMAQRIGMPSIGVEWGVHKRDVLGQYAPHAIVETVAELRQVLGL